MTSRFHARVLSIIGTRPEAIKMAPVVWELQKQSRIQSVVLNTAQHRHMVSPLLDLFNIAADLDLNVMAPNQSLSGLTARLLDGIERSIRDIKPDLVIAQGDTTTVLAAAMVCFYSRIKFAHVEAGLRTGNMQSPYPEEFNRVAVSKISSLNFAPTIRAQENLLAEGVAREGIVITGNTVIDTLFWARQKVAACSSPKQKQMILVTLHRRESFGDPMMHIMSGINDLLDAHPDLHVLFPVHPNPNVVEVAEKMLGQNPRVTLCEPLPYLDLVRAMLQSTVILTDSGGIQEEAPALSRPVFVARENTERPEAVEAGCAKLVGTSRQRIFIEIDRVLTDSRFYAGMVTGSSPYGDGKAASRIIAAIEAAI